MLTEPWPLSAAATQVLVDRWTTPITVLRLSIRELVLSGTWSLERVAPPRRFRGRGDGLLLRPVGAPPLREPLLAIDAALRLGSPAGGAVRDVVRVAVEAERRLGERAREAARTALLAEGLVARWPVTVFGLTLRYMWPRTPAGDAVVAHVVGLRGSWHSRLSHGDATVLSAVAASPGLLLGADRDLLRLVDADVAGRRAAGELLPEWECLHVDDGLDRWLRDLDDGVSSGSGDGGGDGDGGGGD